jgi:hypothetical protein
MCRGEAYGQAGSSTIRRADESAIWNFRGMRGVPIATLGDEALSKVIRKAITHRSGE